MDGIAARIVWGYEDGVARPWVSGCEDGSAVRAYCQDGGETPMGRACEDCAVVQTYCEDGAAEMLQGRRCHARGPRPVNTLTAERKIRMNSEGEADFRCFRIFPSRVCFSAAASHNTDKNSRVSEKSRIRVPKDARKSLRAASQAPAQTRLRSKRQKRSSHWLTRGRFFDVGVKI